MRVALGPLARSGLESQGRSDVATGVEAALRHYVGRLRSGRGAIGYPSFLQEEPFAQPGPAVEVEVDEEVEAELGREAERQGLPVEVLAGHAVLVYLAELDELTDPTPPGEPKNGVDRPT